MQSLTDAGRDKVANFLGRRVSVTLATTNLDGAPRAADVYFVSDADLNLYFYSDPASRHTRNIDRDSRVAATARVESMDWHAIRGVQLEGDAARVDEPQERDKAWRLMCAKFPFYASFTDVVARLAIYRITPRWIRWIDNSVSFGYKEDFSLERG